MSPSTVEPREPKRRRVGFAEDFRRFFVRGLAALLPTLITLWLLVKVWDFLWDALGRHLIWAIKNIWWKLMDWGIVSPTSAGAISRFFGVGPEPDFAVKLLGVALAVIAVYVVGLFVGNIIGRTGWRLLEVGVMRIPLVRAIYPAVKQVTDFLLAERSVHFEGSRVVAIRPHSNDIWSIGLVTGSGLRSLADSVGRDMVTVFIPSSPTSFSGYVVVVPREEVVELPMSVEEAMRLLVTGGVAVGKQQVRPTAQAPAPVGAASPTGELGRL